MEEENTAIDQRKSNERKPTFLVVLAVLSFIYLAFSLFGALGSLFSGPLNTEQMETQKAQLYESKSTLEAEGMDNFSEMIEKSIRYSEYMNFEAFYISHTTNIIISLVGIVAVILMLQLKRIGFHIYVAYSLLPIITMYIITPMELILTISVITMVVISALFTILYGLNLKHMK
ncbi:MAG: hypothetical protein ACQERC_08500 [Bacteroidota bacterium]